MTAVLAETGWVLSTVYELSPAEIATAVEMLVNDKDLILQEADAVAAALDHHRRRPVLGFSDCLVLEVARKAGHLPLACHCFRCFQQSRRRRAASGRAPG